MDGLSIIGSIVAVVRAKNRPGLSLWMRFDVWGDLVSGTCLNHPKPFFRFLRPFSR
jgi:hypothetical protein